MPVFCDCTTVPKRWTMPPSVSIMLLFHLIKTFFLILFRSPQGRNVLKYVLQRALWCILRAVPAVYWSCIGLTSWHCVADYQSSFIGLEITGLRVLHGVFRCRGSGDMFLWGHQNSWYRISHPKILWSRRRVIPVLALIKLSLRSYVDSGEQDDFC